MTVATEGGLVSGIEDSGTGVRSWKGIPYAAPPVGPLRWRAPAAAGSWSGVRVCDIPGPNCPQPRLVQSIDPSWPSMREDCLYLNVWAPANAWKLPVFVWIHGGAYLVGTGAMPAIDGAHLAAQGILVVTFNYRIGVFGFLAHPELSAESDPAASGNYGLLDTIAALAWVRRNIAAFGGDPDNVTIGGSSAGATSVNLLMASPLARGLFQRAIGQGGSAMPASGNNDGSPRALAVEEKKGARFLRQIDASSIEQARERDADALLIAGGAAWADWCWNASIDGRVVPEPPLAVFAGGAQADVPLLLGWNAQEGTTLAHFTFGGDDQPFAPQVRQRFGAVADEVLALYGGDEHAAKVQLVGDGIFGCPGWRWARGHATTAHSPTWLYSFTHAPRIPEGALGPDVRSDRAGAFHGAEGRYVFGNFAAFPGWEPTAADRALAAAVQRYWINFIRSGDPNGDGLPVWPRYADETVPQKMYLSPSPAAGPDRDHARLAFLDGVFRAGLADLGYRGMRDED